MKSKGVLICLLIFLAVMLSGCTKYIYVKEVDCEVIDKHYESSYTTTIPIVISIGNTTYTQMQTQVYPEEYDITVRCEYDGIKLEEELDDKVLYDSHNKGDIVKLFLYKAENKKFYEIRTQKEVK